MAKKISEARRAKRKAVIEKARAAAKAAGKEWNTLSPEERKPFRQQARKESKIDSP
jgi:hypothetical protein